MKVLQLILIGFLFLALSSCSDLLGNEELQAELEKRKGGHFSVSIDCGSSTINEENQPLYVVDGDILEVGKIGSNDLTPNDIESLEVLKGDEALKKYGSDGENGVVLITTKKKVKK